MKKIIQIVAALALLIGSSTPLFAQEKRDDSLAEIFKKVSESRQVILLGSVEKRAGPAATLLPHPDGANPLATTPRHPLIFQQTLLSSAHEKATLDLHLDNPKIQLTIKF